MNKTSVILLIVCNLYKLFKYKKQPSPVGVPLWQTVVVVLQLHILLISAWSWPTREARDMSMNSLSVYIWRPPTMAESTSYSMVNALPALAGLA